MVRFIKKRTKDAGLPPGTLVKPGGTTSGPVRISVFDFDTSHYTEEVLDKIEDCYRYKDTPSVTWINLDGIHDIDTIEKIGHNFGLHPLILEDIINTGSRPKLDDYDDCLFIIIKMLYMIRDNEIESEQVSIIIKDNLVISFQEKEGDVFNPIRDRIRTAKGKIRKMGADYLAYALIDSVVDNYFVIPEKLGDTIEIIEEKLLLEPTTELLQTMHMLKRDMIFLRKSVWPLRDVINSLARGDSHIIKDSTTVYLRDVYDHTIQVMDTIETFRDVLSGLFDMYMTSISNRMNEVMKTLTIIATIFIPLTFVAGIYGMNFEYMPELAWKGAYFVVLGVMIIIGILMLFYFKRKKWM